MSRMRPIGQDSHRFCSTRFLLVGRGLCSATLRPAEWPRSRCRIDAVRLDSVPFVTLGSHILSVTHWD